MSLIYSRELATAIALATSSVAHADVSLAAILAESARAPVVAFERTARAEVRADPEKEPGVVVDRFVPKTTATGEWQLVSIDGRKPTDAEQKRHAQQQQVIPGFHRLHQVLGAPPSRRSVTGDRTLYQWASLPEGAVTTAGGDISKNLSAEATVETVEGKPLISQVRIYAAKPFKIRGIATMNSFEVTSLYRPGAGGRPFLTAQTSASDVSAPFGLGGKRRSQFSFRPLG